jgi:hypothetical protein
MRYGLLLLAINWKVFGSKIVLWTFFAFCTLYPITFSNNTLLATSVLVPVLKETMKKALWVITFCNKLEASCTLLHGTNWCKVHQI